MKIFLAICFLLCGQFVHSQLSDTWVNDDLDLAKLRLQFDKMDQRFHAAIRPYELNDLDTHAISILPLPRFQRSVGSKFLASPILGLESAVENNSILPELDSELRAFMGLRSSYQAHAKLKLNMDVFGFYEMVSSQKNTLLDSSQVVSGIGQGAVIGNGLMGLGMNGALTYSPSAIFSLQVGRGKQFFGHGYRSLLLGDVSSPYPYFKLSTKVWHFNYINLFSWQQGVFDVFDNAGAFENKFTSSHLLSWNITKRLDIQLFESIIWQGQDNLSERGFDMHYLNPVIFFRPVEFSTGSSDNAIIGFGAGYKLRSGYHLYGQVLIDEFLLYQLRDGSGWWANKFGTQLGLKSFDAFGIKDFYCQMEFNLARPFTYSHGSPVQNYAHLNEPLAHPLGANFYDALLITTFPFKGLQFRNQLMYQQYGRDGDEGNLGGNIFRSYVGPENIFGNFIGQGQRFEELSNTLYCSYVMDEVTDFRLQLGYRFLYQFGELSHNQRHLFSLGLRMNFRDPYR